MGIVIEGGVVMARSEDTKTLLAFERETIHRLATEAARYWLLTHFLAQQRLPVKGTWFAYPSGPGASIDWGNPPGPDDPDLQPLRGKRIRVTFEIEDH